jgi:hypothetical protein
MSLVHRSGLDTSWNGILEDSPLYEAFEEKLLGGSR